MQGDRVTRRCGNTAVEKRQMPREGSTIPTKMVLGFDKTRQCPSTADDPTTLDRVRDRRARWSHCQRRRAESRGMRETVSRSERC